MNRTWLREKRSRWIWLGLVGASLLQVGCAHRRFEALGTRLVASQRGEPGPELIVPPHRAAAELGRVAIVWPSTCANETSAQQRGDATSAQSVSTIDCSIEMAAFERMLVRQGIDVIHWDTLRRQALAANTSADAVAQQMGVTLLLRVNSFERGAVLPARDARWERQYLASRGVNNIGRPIMLPARWADWMDILAERYEAELLQQSQPAVTLDVTAVHVPSGEVSWFYRWTHYHAAPGSDVSGVLFALCYSQGCVRKGVSQSGEHATENTGARMGSVRALSRQAAHDDSAVVFAQLTNEVIGDLAQRIRRLEQAPSSPPVAVRPPAAAPVSAAAREPGSPIQPTVARPPVPGVPAAPAAPGVTYAALPR